MNKKRKSDSMGKFLTSKKMFNGGPSIDWIQFRPKMKSYFNEEDCWDLVEFSEQLRDAYSTSLKNVLGLKKRSQRCFGPEIRSGPVVITRDSEN